MLNPFNSTEITSIGDDFYNLSLRIHFDLSQLPIDKLDKLVFYGNKQFLLNSAGKTLLKALKRELQTGIK